ncbi:hypothetical protein GGI03_001387 [Coemansia sp. RSA 2337]|nr:hypothetical protein H4S03_009027 [Coemansia sp. S3946]KAJ2067528.1 hypothetical protein GGI08_001333 [Coemansia sp. S2]KAJ2071257.1 hypothetical protein GGH13_003475 [Coemansia sp. S155-1]KAJ2352592.1 hypothetical protein GGH92_001174 [Coemansia sp. RSA 2673]KAJ2467768.1 hypothetical protein GGI03_001387 [Coemansia sp. RSA 2337]
MFVLSRRHYSYRLYPFLYIRHVHSIDGIGLAPPFSALDETGIELIRRRLANAAQNKVAQKFKYAAGAGEAAVLLLLCTVGGQPSIVFEERQRRLTAHGGEACFAGGKADIEDPTLVHTALRETREELGLDPACVTVLGRLPPVPNKTAALRVHPVVGVMTKGTLEGLALNRDEVHRAFALPLSHFYRAENRDSVPGFRNTGLRVPVYNTDKPGLRIWGLTAFILHEFLCRISDPTNDESS